MTAILFYAQERALGRDEYVFFSRKGGHSTKQRADQVIKQAAWRATLQRTVHTHFFRHGYAINFLNCSGRLDALQEQLGHKDITTTRIYLRLSDEDVKQEVSKIQFENKGALTSLAVWQVRSSPVLGEKGLSSISLYPSGATSPPLIFSPIDRSASEANIVTAVRSDDTGSGGRTGRPTLPEHRPDWIQEQVTGLRHPPAYDHNLWRETVHKVENADGEILRNAGEVPKGVYISGCGPGCDSSSILSCQSRKGSP